jgi:hypothetical protein
MADFAGFALAVARADGQQDRAIRILERLEAGRAEMLGQSEPIWLALDLWLETPANVGRQVTSSILQAELTPIALAKGLLWPYKNGHSLGQRLAHIRSYLRRRFRVEVERDSSNQRLYRFWPKVETLNRPESRSEELQAA